MCTIVGHVLADQVDGGSAVKIPLQISSRNLSLSDAAMETIKQKAEKLETFCSQVMSCRVMVEAPHRHKSHGMLYNVRLDITVPGSELVVRREPNEDLYVAIRDAFDAARKQLTNFSRRRKGEVKKHVAVPTGRVTSVSPVLGYGFLETDDGREVYFSTNSMVDGDLDSLEIGTEVRYSEKQGFDGPQASSVVLV